MIEEKTRFTPVVKFGLDIDLDIKKICEYLNRISSPGGLDFRQIITEIYPELNEAVALFEPQQTGWIETWVRSNYFKNRKKYQELVNQIEKVWDLYQGEFFEKTNKLFPNTSWPQGKYFGYLTICPPCPRYLEDKTFQLPIGPSEEWVKVITHEILHFLFFEYVRIRYLSDSCSAISNEMYQRMEGKLTVSLWDLSEIFNLLVLTLKQFGQGGGSNLEAYPSLLGEKDRLGVIWAGVGGNVDDFFSKIEK